MLSRTVEIGEYVRSLVTTAEGKPFGLKAGDIYEVVGFPYNRNSGIVLLEEENGEITAWSEHLLENVEESE